MTRTLKVFVVLGVIAIIGVVAYRRSSPSRQPAKEPIRHSGKDPLVAEIERLEADIERLLAELSSRTESIEAVAVKLGNAMTELDNRRSQTQVEIEAARRALDEQSELLGKYEGLAEKKQGAILPDGQYISADVVDRQCRYEFNKLKFKLAKLDILGEHLENIERIRRSTKQRHERAKTALAKLYQSAEQLCAERDQLALYCQSYLDHGGTRLLPSSDFVRLQIEIEGIQDYLDELFQEVPETINIEPLTPAETSLIPKRQVLP